MPGSRQHLAAIVVRDRSRSPSRDDKLQYGPELTQWLEDYAWGKAKACDVVRNAANKVKGGSRDKRIIRIGHCASSIGNAQRMVESLIPLHLCPPMTRVAGDSSIQYIFNPFEMFHWLRRTNMLKFRTSMGARPDGLEAWWQGLLDRPVVGRRYWNANPLLRGKTPADLRYHVPLVMFDDAGPCSKTNSTYARQWYSIVGKGSDLDSRFLMATGIKCDTRDHSWPELYAAFEKLAGPVEDREWGAVALFFGADLEYAGNDLGLASTSAAEICTFCGANTTDVPFNDLSRGAHWRGRVKDNAEFVACIRPRHDDGSLHHLATKGWISKWTYRLCLMHVFDHNGVSGSIAANVFDTLLKTVGGVVPGATIQDRLDLLNAERLAYYMTNHVEHRMAPLKLTNIVLPSEFPELHGHFVKAANTRALMPLVLSLCDRHLARFQTDEAKHMQKVTAAVCGLYDVLYSSGCFLEVNNLREVEKCCKKSCEHYQCLAVSTMHTGIRRWKMPIKVHYACGHIPEQCKLLNPIYAQGYRSESMVGKVTAIYKSLQDGQFAEHIQRKAGEKYCLGLLIGWSRESIE